MRILIIESEINSLGVNTSNSDFDKAIVEFIQNNYFNGADNAVIFIGYTYINDERLFKLDLIPN